MTDPARALAASLSPAVRRTLARVIQDAHRRASDTHGRALRNGLAPSAADSEVLNVLADLAHALAAGGNESRQVEQEWVTVSDVSSFLGVPARTVRHWAG